MRANDFLLSFLAVLLCAPAGAHTSPTHGIAMHGDLKYGPRFTHFDYVDAKAPKGGEVRLGEFGTFDSFNPFIIKGNVATGIGLVFDTLLTPSADEPFSEYGLLAEKVEAPPDRSWVAFTLRAQARWHDGRPVTVEDVIWTFDTLRTKGQPFYRAYYAGVDKVEKTGDRTVKFTFKPGDNRELPLILGQLVILPKHDWAQRKFEETTLNPLVGNGAYRIDSFEPGRFISYRRVPDYWGKDLPVSIGRHNFDVIRYDYYRDATVELEAFKAGEYDYRMERSAKEWKTGYDIPAVHNKLLVRDEVPHGRPAGMQCFAFNARRKQFQDARVRRAITHAFDFEWSNKNLFHDQYTRTRSYFDNSELAATGLPDAAESAVLEPFRSRVPAEVFTTEYQPPKTDASGNMRENLRTAVELLSAAGWRINEKTRKLAAADGQPLTFEILLNDPFFERVALPFTKNLERLGIDAKVRTVDPAQYQRRVDDFDFDLVVTVFAQSLSPGNEQRNFWSTAFADQAGSQNVIGIEDLAVDGLVEQVIAAPDRRSLVTRARALDRVLQWGHWVVPHWHIRYDRLAFWDKFGRPGVVPTLGAQFDTWWIDPTKAASLVARKKGLQKE